jgi:hypothetical protein
VLRITNKCLQLYENSPDFIGDNYMVIKKFSELESGPAQDGRTCVQSFTKETTEMLKIWPHTI